MWLMFLFLWQVCQSTRNFLASRIASTLQQEGRANDFERALRSNVEEALLLYSYPKLAEDLNENFNDYLLNLFSVDDLFSNSFTDIIRFNLDDCNYLMQPLEAEIAIFTVSRNASYKSVIDNILFYLTCEHRILEITCVLDDEILFELASFSNIFHEIKFVKWLQCNLLFRSNSNVLRAIHFDSFKMEMNFKRITDALMEIPNLSLIRVTSSIPTLVYHLARMSFKHLQSIRIVMTWRQFTHLTTFTVSNVYGNGRFLFETQKPFERLLSDGVIQAVSFNEKSINFDEAEAANLFGQVCLLMKETKYGKKARKEDEFIE